MPWVSWVQNFMQISPGVPELWLDKQTDKQTEITTNIYCLIMIRDWGWGVHDPSRRQVLSRGMGSGPSGGSRTHPPLPLQILMILFKMFYDDWCMDVGKGLGVWSAWSVEKAGSLPVNGIGPQWGITHSSPTPPFNMGVNVDLDPTFCDDYFINVLRGLGLRDAWYTEKADPLPVNEIGPHWWITHSFPLPPP